MITKRLTAVVSTFLFTLFFSATALGDCYRASSSGNEMIARAFHAKVMELENKRPQPKARPTVVVQMAKSLEAPDLGTGDDAVKIKLRESACLNNERILRDIRTSAGTNTLSVAFISSASDEFARKALDRVSAIGSSNMDPETANVISAGDINYVVVIGGNMRARPYRCTFDFEWDVSIDVHSVATREVTTVAKRLGRLEPRSGTNYLRLIPQTTGQKRLVLKSSSMAPVCLGEAKFEARSSSGGSQYSTWQQNVGCINTGGEAYIRSPSTVSGNGWATTGEVTITPNDSCDLFLEDDFPIAAVFAQSGSSNTSSLGASTSGFPNGHSLPCGCHGTALLNQPFASPVCASGRAINRACNFACPTGGWQYSPLCIP